MKTETVEGREVREYQGQPVSPAIVYSAEFEAFENVAELRNAGAFPNDKEILDTVNNKLRTAAIASAYQKATADLKKAYENSPAKARKDFVETAMRAPMDREAAEKLADTLGFKGQDLPNTNGQVLIQACPLRTHHNPF